MSSIELQEVIIEPAPKKIEEKENREQTWSTILSEIIHAKTKLTLIQKIKFKMVGVVKIEKGKYLKKCPDCGDIYLTDDPDDYYCPEG